MDTQYKRLKKQTKNKIIFLIEYRTLEVKVHVVLCSKKSSPAPSTQPTIRVVLLHTDKRLFEGSV